jgi:hypothetical protein
MRAPRAATPRPGVALLERGLAIRRPCNQTHRFRKVARIRCRIMTLQRRARAGLPQNAPADRRRQFPAIARARPQRQTCAKLRPTAPTTAARARAERTKQQHGGRNRPLPVMAIRSNVGLQLSPWHCIRRSRLNNQSSNTLDAVVGHLWKFQRHSECLSRTSLLFVLHQHSLCRRNALSTEWREAPWPRRQSDASGPRATCRN